MKQLLIVLLCVQLILGQVQVTIIQSARDTGDRLTEKSPITLNGTNFSAPNTISINTTATFQQVLGFGGAFTEAAAYVYSNLTPENKKIILNAYFGPNGLNYSVCRVHINSCDFSLASYSEDDIPGDFNLTYFDISHDLIWLVPFIQDALAVSASPIRIYGTPWSPPAWMKGNEDMTGSSVPGLLPDPVVHQSWALFLSKWISSYESLGIPIWGLTVQNEPEFAAPWEACVYSAENQRDFIKNFLGPQMSADHPDLHIMIYDHNKDHIVNWVDTIFSDPDAAQYVSGTAFHWYSGPQFDNLLAAHEAYPNKFLLATEACNCPPVFNNWAGGESYAYDILGDLNSYAVGWVDWNMMLDWEGGPNHLRNFCDAPILADYENQTIHIQPTYYYMGQISKFVAPGSTRLGISVPSSLSAAAFLTPANQVVLVAMNTNNEDAQFKLEDSVAQLYGEYTLPAHSIVTFIYDYVSSK